MEEKINVTIRGTAPLLMHRFGGEPKKMKRSKTEYDPKEEAESSLYTDEKGKLVQLATHLEACMIKSAVQFKMQGKKTSKDAVKAGVFVKPEMIPHKIQEWEIFTVPVVIQRSRILRSRARLNKWELNFAMKVIDERLTPNIVKEILVNAGKFVGIGDWRPRYGRFEVIKFEIDGKSQSS